MSKEEKTKMQPQGEESFLVNQAPKSDQEIALRNRRLYRERKNRNKTCAQSGCPTKLNRWSKKFCMVHKSQDESNERSNLLREHTPKYLLERFDESA